MPFERRSRVYEVDMRLPDAYPFSGAGESAVRPMLATLGAPRGGGDEDGLGAEDAGVDGGAAEVGVRLTRRQSHEPTPVEILQHSALREPYRSWCLVFASQLEVFTIGIDIKIIKKMGAWTMATWLVPKMAQCVLGVQKIVSINGSLQAFCQARVWIALSMSKKF